MERSDISIGGSAFWVFIILIGFTSLIFLLLWSFHNNSVQGVVVSLIFLIMIVAGILLSRLKVFDMSSWGDNALSLSLGFIIWSVGSIFLTPQGQSVISFGQNNLFATIASELPQLMEFSLNVFLVPIAEELLWMIGIPFALITIMSIVGEKTKATFFSNGWVQIIFVSIIGGLTFAIFHVGKLFVGFVVSAIIFRTVMVVLVYGEQKYNLISYLNVVASFSIGAHIANNLATVGFSQSLLIIQSNFWPVGFIIVLFMGIMLLSGIERMIGLFAGKQTVEQKIFVER